MSRRKPPTDAPIPEDDDDEIELEVEVEPELSTDDSPDSVDLTDQPAELDPISEADDASQALVDARVAYRLHSERLHAIAVVAKELGDLLHPAVSPDAVLTARVRRRPMDKLVKGDLELAIRALAQNARAIAATPIVALTPTPVETDK